MFKTVLTEVWAQNGSFTTDPGSLILNLKENQLFVTFLSNALRVPLIGSFKKSLILMIKGISFLLTLKNASTFS